MTNMRAYRDGNRMVLVIENPTRDLESLVASIISGEITAVKELDKPKEMAKPAIDTRHMEEIKPANVNRVETTINKEETPAFVEKKPATKKLPRFVRNAKEKKEEAVMAAVSETPVTSAQVTTEPVKVVTTKPSVSSVNAAGITSTVPIEHVSSETKATKVPITEVATKNASEETLPVEVHNNETTAEKSALDTKIAESEELAKNSISNKEVSEIVIEEVTLDDEKEETVVAAVPTSPTPVIAEPEEVVTNVVSPVAVAKNAAPVPAPTPIYKEAGVKANAQSTVGNPTRPNPEGQGRSKEFMALLKFVSLHKNSPMVRNELMKRYRNPAYPLERLSYNQIKWFAERLRKI